MKDGEMAAYVIAFYYAIFLISILIYQMSEKKTSEVFSGGVLHLKALARYFGHTLVSAWIIPTMFVFVGVFFSSGNLDNCMSHGVEDPDCADFFAHSFGYRLDHVIVLWHKILLGVFGAAIGVGVIAVIGGGIYKVGTLLCPLIKRVPIRW